MPKLFGRSYTPLELRQFAGDMQQLAGIRLVEYGEGRARGLRAAQVWTGSGLRFEVLLDRALDIGAAEHNGRALAWTFPTLAAPTYYEPRLFGWTRTWGGGLMTTCGLDFFGQPENDRGQELGLHGRISHIPAENVRVTREWQGDEYVLEVEGQSRQAVIFGENLLLTRRVRTRLGADSFTVHDTILNDGFRPAPHMILYHCNFGFPVVSPDSELLVDEESYKPRDAAAEQGAGQQNRFEPPGLDYPEQVFFHKPRADADGYATAQLINRQLNFGGYVKWRLADLPYMGQWKLMQAGEYVCAVEPANYWETPRQQLRQEGRLRMLAPGERVEYELEFGALAELM